MNIQSILIPEKWKVFNLEMTKSGYEFFSNELQKLNETNPQIYIHISIDNNFKKNILRIGSAKNGVIHRWIKSSNGHGSTFLYSIGESERYKNSATRYPNYLIFFAEQYTLKTQLYVLDCKDDISMKNIEKELIKYFNPTWEQFKKVIKEYLKLHIDIKIRASQLGGALEILNTENDIPSIKDYNSYKLWEIDNKS